MANPTLISTLKNFQFNDALNDFLSFSCPSMQSAYNAAVFSGLLAITTHLLISQICKLFGNKIIAKDSGFAAHQVVGLEFLPEKEHKIAFQEVELMRNLRSETYRDHKHNTHKTKTHAHIQTHKSQINRDEGGSLQCG